MLSSPGPPSMSSIVSRGSSLGVIVITAHFSLLLTVHFHLPQQNKTKLTTCFWYRLKKSVTAVPVPVSPLICFISVSSILNRRGAGRIHKSVKTRNTIGSLLKVKVARIRTWPIIYSYWCIIFLCSFREYFFDFPRKGFWPPLPLKSVSIKLCILNCVTSILET